MHRCWVGEIIWESWISEVSGRGWSPHQPVGVGIKGVSTDHQRGTGTGSHGQHHRNVVLQQTGQCGEWALWQEALRLWKWLNAQGISLIAQHLAGSLNAMVDKLSRCYLVDHEWWLPSKVAQGIFQQ